jgi:hypothetical protein
MVPGGRATTPLGRSNKLRKAYVLEELVFRKRFEEIQLASYRCLFVKLRDNLIPMVWTKACNLFAQTSGLDI